MFHSRRSPTGHRITNRWFSTPSQAGKTVEPIGDLRQEAVLASKGPKKLYSAILHVYTHYLNFTGFCYIHLITVGGIPESHLASVGEVASLHDGVLWNIGCRAGER